MAEQQPPPIIQEIHLRVISGAEADRALDRIEAGASEAADSLRDTAAAAGQAGRAVNQAGQQAEGGGSGGGEGPWKRFKRTVSETSEGIGKMSFVTQGFGFLLGAISGGALATFIGQLGSVIDSIAGPLGWATSVKLITEDLVKAKTGLDDLTGGLDDFARSLGLANEKSLTFLERAQGLQAVLNGGSQNRAAAEAKAKQDYADIVKTRALLVLRPDSADLQAQLRFLEQDLALQEKLQKQFAIINGDRANDGSVDARALKPTGKPKTSGGGGRRQAAQPVGGTFFGLDRTAAGVASGLAAGPAFGPADDPVARQLAALSAQPATFDAATASINAYADAQARAFDIELAQQYLDVLNAGLDQFGQGIAASAANAILFGESFTKGVNQAMKALAAQALAQSLFEGAAAVGSLAMGNIPAAIKHGEAAALYAGVAAFAALGAAATGGLRSGGGGAGAAGGAGGGSLARPAANQTQAPPQFTIVLSAGAVHDAVVFEADARSGQRSARRVSVERAA